MAIELSYVLITPYSLKKSRTGGIIARLLSRTDLELVAARMIAPDKAFAEAYAESLQRRVGSRDEFAAKILSDYVRDNFAPLADGRRERLMLLLFRGENACEKLYKVVGQLPNSKNRNEDIYGDTIRDTYCNLVFNRDGSLLYFEPAVFTPPHIEGCIERLKLIADFIDKEDNIVDNIVRSEDENGRERTLVIIKPDNWRRPSIKPGNIIDMFSRTCLRIIGCKVYQMSVAEALEFYGPVQNALRKKLAENSPVDCFHNRCHPKQGVRGGRLCRTPRTTMRRGQDARKRNALPAKSRRTERKGQPYWMARFVYLRRSAPQIRRVRGQRSGP